MTDLLVRWFVKDYEQIEKVSVRTRYGVLASVAGIFCNVFLAVVKLMAGMMLHSVSVLADAFNNLSDAGASVIGYVGVKMAEKPADKEHPFGHGRMEYIAALVVSFMVIEVGITFLKDSVSKILHPEALNFQMTSVVILVLSVGVKFWLGRFNRTLGKRVDSQVMLATAADSMGDMVATSATIFSMLVWRFAQINIDGYVGVCVSLVIMWAGFEIAKDTLEPLIGEAVPEKDYRNIKNFVEKYDGILGSHDLIVHSYGPGRNMASIHAEVPNDVPIDVSHEIIDQIERDAAEELGIFLVIHMDPIEMKDQVVLGIRRATEMEVSELDPAVSIHDFRLVHGQEQMNLIFDLVVPWCYKEDKNAELCRELTRRMQKKNPKYCLVITVEQSYVAECCEEAM